MKKSSAIDAATHATAAEETLKAPFRRAADVDDQSAAPGDAEDVDEVDDDDVDDEYKDEDDDGEDDDEDEDVDDEINPADA